MITLQERVELMVKLGRYLSEDGPALQRVKEKAFQSNSWFIPEFIDLAVKNICDAFLEEDRLLDWVRQYFEPGSRFVADRRLTPGPGTRNLKPQTSNPEPGTPPVGIVMAGNIPLVGFHDFLCGFMSGYPLALKLSGKDEVLLTHLLDVLSGWEPSLRETIRTGALLKNCRAYIATGSNNSARYFEYYFAKYPHIIRRNRTSVAVLDGRETRDELAGLAADIFQYFGLGCRNVTKIYIPGEYDFEPLLAAFREYDFVMDHHRYKNNFDYHHALFLLNSQYYMSSGNLLLTENSSVFSPVSVLHFEKYEDESGLIPSLQKNVEIQCIVGAGFIPFGAAQRPELTDYADGVDTMQFLLSVFSFL